MMVAMVGRRYKLAPDGPPHKPAGQKLPAGMVEDSDHRHEEQKPHDERNMDGNHEDERRKDPACQSRFRWVKGKRRKGCRLARAMVPGMHPAEEARMMHKPVSPVIISIMHDQVDEHAQ